MNISTTNKVNDFLSDVQSISSEQFDMVISIRDIFLRANEKLVEGIKYGGLVFNVSDALIGGIYSYKEHISIEFSNGADFIDSDSILEGDLETIKKKMSEVFARLLPTTQERLAQAGNIVGKPLVVYKKMRQSVYFEIDMGVEILSTAGGGDNESPPPPYHERTLAGGLYFKVDMHGCYDYLQHAWRSAFLHLPRRQLKFDHSRLPFERYHNTLLDTAAVDDYRTSIYIPIK